MVHFKTLWNRASMVFPCNSMYGFRFPILTRIQIALVAFEIFHFLTMPSLTGRLLLLCPMAVQIGAGGELNPASSSVTFCTTYSLNASHLAL
jgi:hypothetical protein